MTEKLQRYKYGYTSDEWGMNSHLGLIPDAAGSVYRVDDVNKAIEAMQARVLELTRLNEASVPMDTHIAAIAGRDTALAKLRELKGQEPVAWGMVAHGVISDVICPETHEAYVGPYTIPLYLAARPVPATTAITYMEGYSDCKEWALEEAAKVCESLAITDCPDSTDARLGCAIEIRKLVEGL